MNNNIAIKECELYLNCLSTFPGWQTLKYQARAEVFLKKCKNLLNLLVRWDEKLKTFQPIKTIYQEIRNDCTGYGDAGFSLWDNAQISMFGFLSEAYYNVTHDEDAKEYRRCFRKKNNGELKNAKECLKEIATAYPYDVEMYGDFGPYAALRWLTDEDKRKNAFTDRIKRDDPLKSKRNNISLWYDRCLKTFE